MDSMSNNCSKDGFPFLLSQWTFEQSLAQPLPASSSPIEGQIDNGDSTLPTNNVQTTGGDDTAENNSLDVQSLIDTTSSDHWTYLIGLQRGPQAAPALAQQQQQQSQLPEQLPTITPSTLLASSARPSTTPGATAGQAKASSAKRGRGRPPKAAEDKAVPFHLHCRYCRDQQSYKRGEGLRQHMAVHHGLLPEGDKYHECEQCGARFGRASDLNRHKRCKGEHKDNRVWVPAPTTDEEVADTFGPTKRCKTMSNNLIVGREAFLGRSDPRATFITPSPSNGHNNSSASPVDMLEGIAGPSTWANPTAPPPPPAASPVPAPVPSPVPAPASVPVVPAPVAPEPAAAPDMSRFQLDPALYEPAATTFGPDEALLPMLMQPRPIGDTLYGGLVNYLGPASRNAQYEQQSGEDWDALFDLNAYAAEPDSQ